MSIPAERRGVAFGRAVTVTTDTPLRRVADVAVGCALLLVTLPLLVVLIFAIATTSSGPVIFRQRRVGRGGRPFAIWKFRTMLADAAERGSAVSGRADPRTTPVGRLLRSTRLDELPQLVNLVRGEMTLVGPRPEVPRFVDHYTVRERRLLEVRPGIIGPGAVLFAAEQSDELDNATDPDEFYLRYHLHPKLALDLAYLRERGIAADLRLVLAAIRAALRF